MRAAVVAIAFAIALGIAGRTGLADPSPARSTVFGEFLGAGFGIMANYDHRIRRWLSLRGGLGYSFSTRVQFGIGIFSRTDKDTKTIPVFGLAAGWTL